VVIWPHGLRVQLLKHFHCRWSGQAGPDHRRDVGDSADRSARRVGVGGAAEAAGQPRQLQRALRRRGAEGRCIDLADCRIDTGAAWHGLAIPGFGRELPDAAIVRGIAGGSFEQVTKRLGVLHALRELGVAVYNDARAIERSVDKSMTSLLLHARTVARIGHRLAHGCGPAPRPAGCGSAAGCGVRVARSPAARSDGRPLTRRLTFRSYSARSSHLIARRQAC